MNELPFQENDLVRRTSIDHSPDLDASQGITPGMIGVVTGIDRSTPMFTVLFDNGAGDVYLADELEKVGYRVYRYLPYSHTDVLFEESKS